MTTQFSQRVTYELVLLWSPNNSYFIFSPQTVSINNHCLSFGSFKPFSDVDSILPHYSPAFPADFGQFGQAWCEETIRAYFNHLNISSYINQIQFERVRYQPNGDNSSITKISYCILSCSLLLNNQIDTDFDNLFSNLISSLNTLLTPISQISLSLLGINNIFPTLVHNLEALNENNVPVSIAQILKDKQIDVDMSSAEVSLDDSNLVTQLQNIYTILASQNSNQAAISSAINNKDNQSDIVSILQRLFTFKTTADGNPIGVFTGNNINGIASNTSSFINMLNQIRNALLSENLALNASANESNKSLYLFYRTLRSLFSNTSELQRLSNSDIVESSFLKLISDKLNNIETKLEQNLPFVTNVYPLVETNIDFPYETKVLNKDNCSDNKKNDI